MIILNSIKIQSLNDYQKLKNGISGSHIDNVVIDEISHYIGLKCNKLIIENPYSDRDFLSTYYIHYARKFKKFDKRSYRIHLFRDDLYFGFITLRPTCKRKIGRSYINPSLLIPMKSYLMTAPLKANIVGQDIMIDAFPWMHQEPDVTSCSHVALWEVLRYFSNKHSRYSDANIGDVVEKIQLNHERKIPSKGLRCEQISDLLTQYGFSTLIRRGSENIENEIFTYIESGLPLIGVVKTKKDDAHAVTIIGHGPICEIEIEKINDTFYERVKYKKSNQKTDIILSTKFIDSIIVNDDNLFPYRMVYKDIKALERTSEKYEPQYIIQGINTFIIPLYEKMKITYNEVYNRSISLIHEGNLPDLPSPKILRFFITSSNSFKKEISNRGICSKLRKIMLTLDMPKFIWCAEISSIDNYKNRLIDGLIIIDATDSTEEEEQFLLFHDKNNVHYFNGNRALKDKFEIPAYKMYINNLEEYDNV